jgi:SSS family solute:Na+ symporter
MLSGVRKAEEVVPYFVVNYVPAGLTGLVIAGALAAAMSSLSSSINAASMVWVRDIYKPYIARNKTDQHYLTAGFLSAGLVSLLMVAGAWLFYMSNAKTLNDLGLIIGSICGGGILGVFLVGIFTRCGDVRAIWTALAVNALVTAYILMSKRGLLPDQWSIAVDLYFTALIGNTLTIITALIAGIFFKSRVENFANLTVWDQEKTPLI